MACSPLDSSVRGDSPGKNIGVGCHAHLQGIFPTQGSNPCLLYCQADSLPLSHQGSPRILEWLTYPFSSESSWPRNWTRVSCTESGSFTSWVSQVKNVHTCMTKQIKFLKLLVTIHWYSKRLQTTAFRANLACLFIFINFYRSTVIPTYSQVADGCFCFTKA